MKNKKMLLRIFLRSVEGEEAEYLFLVNAKDNYSMEFLQKKAKDIIEDMEKSGKIFWSFDDLIRRLVRRGYIEEIEKVKIKNVIIYV